MKKLFSFFAFVLTASFLPAQGIYLDTSFGDSGYVHTSLLRPSTTFTSTMDLMPNGNLLLLGTKSNPDGTIFCTYSTLGDSIQGFSISTYTFDNQYIFTFKVLPDGDFLVADSDNLKGLKRFNLDGTPDLAFGVNGCADLFSVSVRDILIGQDGRIFVAGSKLESGVSVIAFTANGILDSSFAVNGVFNYNNGYFDFFNGIYEQPDGKLLAAGCSFLHDGDNFNTLFRLMPNGLPDTTFGENGLVKEIHQDSGDTWGLTLQSDQKILTYGMNISNYEGYINRYLANGSLDDSFGNNGKVTFPAFRNILDVEVLPNGKILAYGDIKGQSQRSAFAQLLSDGTLDPYFGFGGIFFSPFDRFHPSLRMQLVDGNRIIASGSIQYYDQAANDINTYLQLQAFVLDLNVGTTSPPLSPAIAVYPNPMQDWMDVSFCLESALPLKFEIYNLQGQLQQTLLEERKFEAGEQKVSLNINPSLPPGAYLTVVSSGGRLQASIQTLKID